MAIPNGIYTSTFVGIQEYFKATNPKPKWLWKFKISTGPYAGQIVGKTSCPVATETNGCGNMINMLTTAVDGLPLELSLFSTVLYEGGKVRILVRDGKLKEVMPPRIVRVRL